MPTHSPRRPTSGPPDRPWFRPEPISLAPVAEPPAPEPTANPAGVALARVYALFPAAIRLSCGIAVAVVALAVQEPPVQSVPLALAVVVLTIWSYVFYRQTVDNGIRARVVLVDGALTAIACLCMRVLVAPDVMPGGVSWIAVLASTSIITAQFALRVVHGVLFGFVLAASYCVGALISGHKAEAISHTILLVVQTFLAAGLVYVTRRSARAADGIFTEYQRAHRESVIARAAREAERKQNRDLHDTVLSTLTMVGLGGVAGQSPMLRARASADLRTLFDPARRPVADPAAKVSLDERLRLIVERYEGYPLTAALEPCLVPSSVADAIAESADAALSNVVRHAEGSVAWLRLHQTRESATVEVIDVGPGFDIAAIPPYRYGIRESIMARMAAVGGAARIDTAPGNGTRIHLEWVDVG
ncbi:sensor histidine kinase [Asanoa iriomotensis]|uniref:histidine kinase n=1 Tax=Asanoa iriomotensis TaxID=234613 RepID=A0ABQ4BUQ5_9ACTN|nr:ATP-binding protein [Asanoa iriomotensis]GIF54257.1 histidine kinase [Asanoa iriomotensis]